MPLLTWVNAKLFGKFATQHFIFFLVGVFKHLHFPSRGKDPVANIQAGTHVLRHRKQPRQNIYFTGAHAQIVFTGDAKDEIKTIFVSSFFIHQQSFLSIK